MKKVLLMLVALPTISFCMSEQEINKTKAAAENAAKNKSIGSQFTALFDKLTPTSDIPSIQKAAIYLDVAANSANSPLRNRFGVSIDKWNKKFGDKYRYPGFGNLFAGGGTEPIIPVGPMCDADLFANLQEMYTVAKEDGSLGALNSAIKVLQDAKRDCSSEQQKQIDGWISELQAARKPTPPAGCTEIYNLVKTVYLQAMTDNSKIDSAIQFINDALNDRDTGCSVPQKADMTKWVKELQAKKPAEPQDISGLIAQAEGTLDAIFKEAKGTSVQQAIHDFAVNVQLKATAAITELQTK